VDAELDQQQPPVKLDTVARGGMPTQHPHRLRAAQPLGQPRILGRTLLDSFLEQGQEQVGLVAEPGLHYPPGESRLVGDLIQRDGLVAAGQEDPAGRRLGTRPRFRLFCSARLRRFILSSLE